MILGAILLSLLAGQSDSAPPGMPASSRPIFVSHVDQARKVAQCIRGREPAAASSLILIGFKGLERPERSRLLSAFARCVPANTLSMTVQPSDLSGIMAEGMLRDDDSAMLHRASGLRPVPATRVVIRDPKMARETVINCVVAAQPKDAAMMLDGAPASVQEANAFRTLIPSFQACVPEKFELHMQPYEVRLLVASALYRQAVQPSVDRAPVGN